MPEQPDFTITAFIPSDGDHVQQTVPAWCDLVVDIERDENSTQRSHLTRRAGEILLDTVNDALHPTANKNLRGKLWEDLDLLTDLIMDGDDDSDMTKGKAAGIARCLALITQPYNPNEALDEIREEAVARWESR